MKLKGVKVGDYVTFKQQPILMPREAQFKVGDVAIVATITDNKRYRMTVKSVRPQPGTVATLVTPRWVRLSTPEEILEAKLTL